MGSPYSRGLERQSQRVVMRAVAFIPNIIRFSPAIAGSVGYSKKHAWLSDINVCCFDSCSLGFVSLALPIEELHVAREASRASRGKKVWN